MGQTLTHGIYLPDEGERNCYSGLAANWQILDNSVGTIAAHTAALAGKAPLVHTHTKADITDFPVYGNTAGTICEGNDSRLSDARTPVAHTHGKADITDLFNSANTWTNTNTFQQNITYERTNFFHQAANPCYYLKDTELEKGSIPPAAHTAYPGMWQDKNSTFLGYVRFVEYATGKQTAEIRVSNLIKNGALDPTGSTVNCSVNLELQPSGEKSLIPEQNNDINLGTSTNKWKTLNGTNPGALSLPSGGTTENTDWYNVAGDILPTGGNATSFSRATANYFTPAKAGWLALAVKNCSELSVWCETLKYGISIVAPDTSLNRQVVIPVVAGKSYQILITGNSWVSARLIMPQGNV